MIRKTALLAGLAGAFVFTAPALAQDATSSTEAATEQSAQPSSLTLTPGTTVKSKDGTELGKLVGVQAGASGQELTVRGADGQVRAVPVTGIEASGADIAVAATLSDYQSASPVAASAPTPTADPVDPPMPSPSEPILPSDPATDDSPAPDNSDPADVPPVDPDTVS